MLGHDLKIIASNNATKEQLMLSLEDINGIKKHMSIFHEHENIHNCVLVHETCVQIQHAQSWS